MCLLMGMIRGGEVISFFESYAGVISAISFSAFVRASKGVLVLLQLGECY